MPECRVNASQQVESALRIWASQLNLRADDIIGKVPRAMHRLFNLASAITRLQALIEQPQHLSIDSRQMAVRARRGRTLKQERILNHCRVITRT